jgi:hypothetical protein
MTKDSEESKTHLAGEEKFQCEEVEVYIVCWRVDKTSVSQTRIFNVCVLLEW